MDIIDKIDRYLTELAMGWDRRSVEKFGKSIGIMPDEHGFFDKCVLTLTEKGVKNPKGLCAEMKDKYYGSTMWRGKGKPKEEMPKIKKK